MRLTIVILIATLVQVSAAGFAQKISMSKSNASLLNVFKEIRSQSGYNFVCPESILKNARPVTINVKNADLREVLNEIFNKQSLTYTIDSKVVVVTEKKPSVVDVLFGNSRMRQDSLLFKGRVLDEKGNPLVGATIRLKGGTKASVANPTGYFERYGTPKSTMVISFLGYQTQEISLRGQDPDVPIIIRLVPGQSQLGEVSIVSTGYQDIPKERATGSFEVITARQLEHSTDPSLLKRLEGITTSMDFRSYDRSNNPSSARSRVAQLNTLTIRGRNTLNSFAINTSTISPNPSGIPLVVIDGIATDINIETIDPNTVESVNILKDAAAASIWGSRAANGVIVIRTKRGSLNTEPRVSFNANFNSVDKLDLFYKKQMSVSEYVDAQVFANPRYWDVVPNPTDPVTPQPFMSPVAEIINLYNLNQIDSTEMNRRLNALRGNDLRRDFTNLFLRNSFVQNYNLAVDGGSRSMTYRLAGSYSNSLATVKGYNSNRYTFNYNSTFNPLKNLKIDALLSYSRGYSHMSSPSALGGIDFGNADQAPYFPYTKLVDDQGNALVVSRDYRPAFIDLLQQTYGSKILDMRWRPLTDFYKSYSNDIIHNINLNTTVAYKFTPFLSANVTYGYNKSIGNTERLQPQDTYGMSLLINRFTNPSDFGRAVPLGAQQQRESQLSDSHTWRGLINLDKTWNEKHNITAIAGMDVSETVRKFRSDQVYGFDPATLKFVNEIDFKDDLFTLFNGPDGQTTARIPYQKTFADYHNRQFSLFANAAYSYDNRYTVSGSIRKDASSAFGPSTNKTGTPYYSFGGAWTINNEKFYHAEWLPNLKLRATYGYNGNVNTSTTADPTITYNPKGTNGLPYAGVLGSVATNSMLRPERAGVLNFGLDFGLKDNKLSGSIEYYVRKTSDLLTQNRIDPSTGFNNLTFNTGDIKSTGVDFILNSMNLKAGEFSWTSNLLFSYNRVKVTKLYVPGAKTAGFLAGNAQYTEGYDLSRIFAWKWAGLDPDSGDPRVYLDGQPVKIDGNDFDVVTRLNDSSIDNLHYFGSAVPVYYGSLRNTFNYGAFSVSANLLYKLGYYSFRKDVVQYSQLFGEFGNNQLTGPEYTQRWKQPGDEKFTNVPSQVFNPGFDTRDVFYKLADINVFKADHIRLQEINLSYAFNKPKWFIRNPRIYANVSNVGIIWRANKLGVDPETFDYPQPRTYSLGFSANF